MAQLKNPTPPVSKTVQRLLAQIHAEAQAATLEALSARDGIVVLQDIDRDTRRVRVLEWLDESMEVHDGSGLRVELDRQRRRHEWSDGLVQRNWRPGQWVVTLHRMDGQGRHWTCRLDPHITDDFGNLVSVEGGAA